MPDPAAIDRHLPLPGLAFQVLLVLAGADNHGYGIAKEVESNTAGRTRVGTGSLYLSMAKLADQGMIEPSDPPPASRDRRRRYYRLTDMGRDVAAAEAHRLAALVRLAGERDLVRPNLAAVEV
jgi:DNA-binding PadR family transcriptional regulator